LRLRIIRAGESFKIICAPDQLEKMQRVIAHNGGADKIEKTEPDAVYLIVQKLPPSGDE